jgi:hypothetical protein
LHETLSRAWTNNSALVQIITWNDFGEGTTIEPTKEYGFRDLYLVQDLCRPKPDSQRRLLTNELASMLEFYQLRQNSATNPPLAFALDQVFTNMVSGQEENGFKHLAKLAAQFPSHVKSAP